MARLARLPYGDPFLNRMFDTALSMQIVDFQPPLREVSLDRLRDELNHQCEAVYESICAEEVRYMRCLFQKTTDH